MSNFAISKIRWNEARTRIIAVKLHQFIVGKHSDLNRSFGIDDGKEADATTVASMIIAGGDIIKVVTYDIYGLPVLGNSIHVVDQNENLVSFDENGNTTQLFELPIF